jgi:hypothetical protein
LGDGITFHRRKNEPHTDLEQGYISVPTWISRDELNCILMVVKDA